MMTRDKDSYGAILDKVNRYIRDNGMDDVWRPGRRVGVALSGGPDSMALLDMAISTGLNPVALHCNFQLRGEESGRDERFVTGYCPRRGVELMTVRFDVAGRMSHTGESVEMACRELRYGWFAEVAGQRGLDAILVGHHADDNVETFLLNLLRGCGIGGAKGIPPRRGIFLRPLLPLTRGEIICYLEQKGIPYIIDRTNSSNDFRRNRLRNIVIPAAEECFPGAKAGFSRSIGHLSADNRLLRSLVSQKRVSYTDGDGRICVRRLLSREPEPLVLLYHLLDGDLDESAVRNIAASINESGKFFTGRSGVCYLLDRGYLVKTGGTPELHCQEHACRVELSRERLEQGCVRIPLPEGDAELHVRLVPRRGFRPRRDMDFAWFDSALLDSPEGLVLRHPRVGDRIQPFGMEGTRLLSDVFSDGKVPLTEKHKRWVLATGPHILWVPGHRTSNLLRVGPSTENIIEFHVVRTGENS